MEDSMKRKLLLLLLFLLQENKKLKDELRVYYEKGMAY